MLPINVNIMRKKEQKEKFDIIEHELFEDPFDDAQYDMEAEVNIPRLEQTSVEAEETRRRRRKKPPRVKKERKNKFGWAFFLCSMFMGIAITATTGIPAGVLGGIGVGFLFFVDPIYEKVMDKIEGF